MSDNTYPTNFFVEKICNSIMELEKKGDWDILFLDSIYSRKMKQNNNLFNNVVDINNVKSENYIINNTRLFKNSIDDLFDPLDILEKK